MRIRNLLKQLLKIGMIVMTRKIIGWNYGMQKEIKDIFKDSNGFNDVVSRVVSSKGIIGRVYYDNRPDKESESEFWSTIIDLYSGAAEFEIDFTSLANVPNTMQMDNDYNVGFDDDHGVFRKVFKPNETMAIQLIIKEYLKSIKKVEQ